MNKKVIYIIVLIGLSLFTACGGDNDSDNTGGGSGKPDTPAAQPQTYQQSVNLTAIGVEMIVKLQNLSSAIRSVENCPVWIVITPQTYTSGVPSIKLEAQENKVPEERLCEVTIVATSGDKLILTIIQQACTTTGIDDAHDEPTDQSAY